jgi:UDP:flavonoid glycosyltransferase YjiC (YdhE family)
VEIVSIPGDHKRILFVAENATMAQVVRLVVLARGLDPARYEVHFACAGFEPLLFAGTSFAQHDIFSLPRAAVERASAKGKAIHSEGLGVRIDLSSVAPATVSRPRVVTHSNPSHESSHEYQFLDTS